MAKNFSPEVVEKLLDKLSTDDHFRELFQKEPHAALRQLGHETPEGERGVKGSDPMMCFAGAALASKEEIKASRSKLATRLSTSPFHYNVFAA